MWPQGSNAVMDTPHLDHVTGPNEEQERGGTEVARGGSRRSPEAGTLVRIFWSVSLQAPCRREQVKAAWTAASPRIPSRKWLNGSFKQ